jgi:acetyltransferase-like isoleucine patch superfamily enzyme
MWLSGLLYKLYSIKSGRIRSLVIMIVLKLEGGETYSKTLRRIYRDYHKVDVGMYTHGGCFVPYNVTSQTTIGRYCSISRRVRVLTRNHPMGFRSTHAIFFNPIFKLCDKHLVEESPLKIGNDVWIGEYAVILAHVTEIGDGAVIGAGAIINKNVPPYAVVVGNPARVVRYRFSKELIDELLASRWWEKDIDELESEIEEFQQPFEKLYLSRKDNAEWWEKDIDELELEIEEFQQPYEKLYLSRKDATENRGKTCKLYSSACQNLKD